jgi:uncharacterized 2Fe-2S/4Fe-4S cluster protein (DUF4445 family)
MDGGLAAKSDRIEPYKRTFNYVIRRPREDGNEPLIRITQNDVRAIQMAKAALYAGVRLLMDRLNIAEVSRIRLAGAFGSHIDMKYAMVLGLIPDCDLTRVQSAGNAAGTGARIALLNKGGRDEIEAVVRRIEKIETAVEAKFQQHFVEAMALPHKTADFVNLKKVVTLPPLKTVVVADEDGGGRRRRRG